MIQKPTKINNFFIISLVSVLLLTLGITQTKNQDLLNLFDGVVKSDASTGDTNPTYVCSTSGYSSYPRDGYGQTSATPTLNDTILSTPLNTPLNFASPMFSTSFSPALDSEAFLTQGCIQTLPNYGTLQNLSRLSNNWSNLTLSDYYAGINITGNPDQFFLFVGSRYVPPMDFVGVACYNHFIDFASPNTNYGAPSSTIAYSTNVSQVKIQVGGSTSTICGADPIVNTSCNVDTISSSAVVQSSSSAISSTNIISSITSEPVITERLSAFILFDSIKANAQVVRTQSSSSVVASNCPSTGGTISIFEAATNSNGIQSLSSASSSVSIKYQTNTFGSNTNPNSKTLGNNLTITLTKTDKSNNLDITDPYDCGLQIITGNVKYDGNTADLNPVNIKLTNTKDTSKTYSFSPSIDKKSDYSIDVKNIPVASYKVDFGINDKLGNKSQGTYDFIKKDVCEDSNNKSITSQEQDSLNLTRTGGTQSSFVYALSILVLTMFVISEVVNKEIED